MHLDDGGIQALLHGELGEDAERWERHAEECPACRARLAAAGADEAELSEALSLLDVPPPTLTADAVRALARARLSGAPRWTPWRVAAAVALATTAAGALYALPGSPLRRAVEALRRAAPADVAEPGAGAAAHEAGVATRIGDAFTVAFETPAAGDTVWIEVVDDSLLSVRADGPASFHSRPDGLTVSGPEGVRYRLLVPGDAPLVRIEADGRPLVEIRSGTLSPELPTDAEGARALPLGG